MNEKRDEMKLVPADEVREISEEEMQSVAGAGIIDWIKRQVAKANEINLRNIENNTYGRGHFQ
jgi:hypothetical protein